MRTVYKDVHDAFPLHISGFKADISAELKIVEKLSGQAKASYSPKLYGLLYDLDESSRNLMMRFRAVYIVYQSSPCGSDDYLRRQTESLLGDHSRLEATHMQIKAIIELAKNNPGDTVGILYLYKAAVDGLRGASLAGAAALEVREAAKDAEHWIEGTSRDDG